MRVSVIDLDELASPGLATQWYEHKAELYKAKPITHSCIHGRM